MDCETIVKASPGLWTLGKMRDVQVTPLSKNELIGLLQELSRLRRQNEILTSQIGDRRIPATSNINELAKMIHELNWKWWHDIQTVKPIERNKGELLCLIHSEISEALEGERKDLMDDHLPHRRMAEVELADALIRICDYAGGFGYDLQGAVEEKLAYNKTRKDHSHEARREQGGKKF